MDIPTPEECRNIKEQYNQKQTSEYTDYHKRMVCNKLRHDSSGCVHSFYEDGDVNVKNVVEAIDKELNSKSWLTWTTKPFIRFGGKCIILVVSYHSITKWDKFWARMQ